MKARVDGDRASPGRAHGLHASDAALASPAKRPLRAAPRGRRIAAFTLVEIVVVTAVLGIAAALVYPRLAPSPAAVLDREVRELAASLEAAARIAQWRGETLGVSFERGGWRHWRRRDDGRWEPYSDPSLRARAIEPPAAVRAVSVGGLRIGEGGIVAMRASGRNDPLSIELASGESSAWIRTDALNRVTASRHGLR